MWINENDKTVIKKAQEVTIDGVVYGKQIFGNEVELNSLNIFSVTVGAKPDADFFTHEEVVDYVSRTVTYLPISKTIEEITLSRYQKLERIFKEKTLGLKSLAIDKPWMNDSEAINDQYRVYEEMYKNALADRYNTETNQAIIVANESAKAALSELTLLLNSVRAVIESMITNNTEGVDEKLAYADGIHLTMAELTSENVGAIMVEFGL